MPKCLQSKDFRGGYYIITKGWRSGGLFALYKTVLVYIVYAYENGYIPVIDMQHVCNQYFKDGREYKDNVWEYFFEQPAGVTLDEIPDGARIILSDDSDVVVHHEYDCLTNNPEDKNLYKKYFGKIKFNQETQKYLDENYKRITKENPEILGILCRGTDYANCTPLGHAMQPEPEEVIKKAKELLKQFNYKKIWLATEDFKIYKMFKDEFGDMLINNDQYKFGDTSDKWLYQVKVNRENHSYNLAKEYLLSIYILSKCKYIIGGITAGTLGVYFLTNGFENQAYTYFWRLGLYSPNIKYNNIIEKIFSVKIRNWQGRQYILTILGKKIKIEIFPVKTRNWQGRQYILTILGKKIKIKIKHA